MRDPFETPVGVADKTRVELGRRAGRARVPRIIYDWNILPIGQLLWLKELVSYVDVPADAGSGELQPRLRSWQQVKKQGAHNRATNR